jgi:single-strand DNA-binding protein
MPSFNRVLLVGNLTRDPNLKYLSNQTAVVDCGIATNRKWKTQDGEDREEVMFCDFTAFGKQAETINQYCQKGKLLLIEGRLKYDTWDDKNGGGKRSKLSVIVENFQFLGGKAEGDSEDAGAGNGRAVLAKPDARPMQQRVAERVEPENPIGEAREFAEDDIPF